MAVVNVLAGVAARDLALSIEWYTRLLGRGPDTRPMDNLAEWQFERGGWLQLFADAERAGHSSMTLAVDDIDAAMADLGRLGIAIGPTTRGEQVATAIFADPDGNQLVFAQGFSPSHAAVR